MSGSMTLLSMVQSILSDIDADEVNSIDDTVEADRVVNIISNVYKEITSPRHIPELMKIQQLYGLSDNNYPNYLEIPEGVSNIQWFQYNTANFPLGGTPSYNFKTITWCEPQDFIDRISRRDLTDTNTVVVSERQSGSELLIRNNQHPRFFTTFDDLYIVCDSWHVDYDDTLQQYKTRVWAKFVPTFTKSNDFVPLLDTNMVPYLLSESTSRAISLFRGQPDPKIEQAARRQKVWILNDKANVVTDPQRPNFGRGGTKT